MYEILSKQESIKNTTVKKKSKKDVKEIWQLIDKECVIQENKNIECFTVIISACVIL